MDEHGRYSLGTHNVNELHPIENPQSQLQKIYRTHQLRNPLLHLLYSNASIPQKP
jgi:hypothetical protein